MNTKNITLHFLNELLSVAAMGVALFWSAGRVDWWAPWAAIVVWLSWFAAMDILMLRFNRDLMLDRIFLRKSSLEFAKFFPNS